MKRIIIISLFILLVINIYNNSLATPAISFKASLFYPSAQDSFNPVYGSTIFSLGFGGLYLTSSEKLSFDLFLELLMRTGNRVILQGNDFKKTNDEVKLMIIPLTATAKYRFRVGEPVVPFIGGGIGLYYYKEDSPDLDIPATSKTSFGLHISGGIELFADRVFTLTLEGRYSYIPNLIGEEGTSAYYDQKDGGGFTLSVVGTYYLE